MPAVTVAVALLVSVTAACSGPTEEHTRLSQAAAAVARSVDGPVAVVTDTPLPGLSGGAVPDVELIAPTTEAIEGVRDSRVVVAPPWLRLRLELKGYLLGPASAGWLRITGRLNCATVRAAGWSPLPGLEFTGRVGFEIPAGAGGSLVIIVGDDGPLQLVAEGDDGEALSLVVESLRPGPATPALPADLWLDRGDPAAAPRDVARVRLAAAPDDARLVGLRFGRRAPHVLARLQGYEGDVRARACAASLAGQDHVTAEGSTFDLLAEGAETLGGGWYGEEVLASARVRWMGDEAVLLASSAVPGPVDLEVIVVPPHDTTTPDLAVVVNGVSLGARPVARGGGAYRWMVPRGVWLAGTNEILLRASATRLVETSSREVGLGVQAVRVHRTP